MLAAVLDTFRKDYTAANQHVVARMDPATRFEPVSRILERCDERSLEIARPAHVAKATNA